jgi:hypothetical protein
MSGTIPAREKREIFPQAAGVIDPDRDLGNVGQLLNRQSQQVAGVLDRAGDAIRAEAEREAVRRGEEKAWADPLKRDADGKIVAPTAEELAVGPFTTAGEQARRGALASRYGSELVVDNQRALLELRSKHRDPAGFAQAAQGWRDGLVETLPPQLKAGVGQALSREIAGHTRDLVGERMRLERRDAEERSAAADALQATRIFDLARQGLPVEEAIAERVGKIDADVAAGVLTPAQGEARRRHATVLAPLLAAGVGAAATGNHPSAGPGDFVRQMFPVEGTGVPRLPNGKPASTAVGHGQFIEGTWLDVLARAKPPEAQGLDPATPEGKAKLLALRGDAGLAERMARFHVAQDLDPALRANGVEPSNLARYAAWHFGKGTGPKVMRAGDGEAMASVVGAEAFAANPYLRGMTVGQWKERFAPRFGGAADTGGGLPEAMRGGPGHPGWRPEWSALSLEEREGFAKLWDHQRTQARQEADYQRVEAGRVAQREASAIQLRITEIQSAAMRENRPLSVAEELEIHGALKRRSEVLAPFGGDDGSALRTATAGAEAIGRQAKADTVNRDAVITGMEALRAASPEAASELARAIINEPIDVQAALIERRLQTLGPAITAARAAARREAAFHDAMNGGDPVDRSRDNQALGKAAIGGDPLDPARAQRVLRVAAAGALPEEINRRGAALLSGGSPEDFARHAELHRAANSDTEARGPWRRAHGDDVADAYDVAARQLQGLDPANEEHRQEIERIRERARDIALKRGPKMEDVLAGLGNTDKRRKEVIEEHMADQLGAKSSAPVPRAMAEAFREVFLDRLGAGVPREIAAEQAAQRLERQGWAVSRIGVDSNGPYPEQALPGRQGARPVELGNDLLPGESAAGPMPRGAVGERWVRHAPERYAARSGPDGAKGTRWLEELATDLAAADGTPGLPARPELGRDLFWRPFAPGGKLEGFHLMRRMPNGTPDFVYSAGRAVPVLMDLGAARAAHEAAWKKEHGAAWLAREAAGERRSQSAARFSGEPPLAIVGPAESLMQ